MQWEDRLEGPAEAQLLEAQLLRTALAVGVSGPQREAIREAIKKAIKKAIREALKGNHAP